MQQNITEVVIVGGGTAGWLTANLLATVFKQQITITLVESKDVASVGVGEATIPPIVPFNSAIGLDEKEFINATQATIKLGIEFENWREPNHSYMHAFGDIGKHFPFCNFIHYWLRAKQAGDTRDLWQYSVTYQAAKNNKFNPLATIPNTKLPGLSYAYHFDASLYAKLLKQKAIDKGVNHIEGKISSVSLDEETGFVTSLELEDKQRISGQLFIDCSGLHGLLLDKTMNVGFEDWGHYLPCDRALAVPCEHGETTIKPYTRSIAHEAGWQWQIPLKHRIGNGLVYSSKHLSDDKAKELLLSNLPGKPLAEPKLIRFRTGRRLKQWHKNVVAIGLSSGFLEPLESTSIHLIQTAAVRLVKHFPMFGFNQSVEDEYNRQSQEEFEHIRDFIILHYKQTLRNDTAFWRQNQQMDIPETLQRKIQLFKDAGLFFREDDELFSEVAWQQVMIGQGIEPQSYLSLADQLSTSQLTDMLDSLETLMSQTSKQLMSHNDYLKHLEQ